MRLWHAWTSRLRSLLFRRRGESAMDEELRLHVALETERLRAEGLPAHAARRQALRDFGGIEQTKEVCRDARGTTSVEAILRDTRHAARRLRRDWRFSVGAVVILGLGIGATTAVFSAVNAVMFRGQIVDADRLVNLYQNARDDGSPAGSSYPAYRDMAAYTNIFASTAAASMPDGATFRDGNGGLRSAVVEYASATYLATLGLRPTLGRWFEQSEERVGAALVAVVGHGTWIRKFGADPSVIGRTIRIQGTPVTIVGVGPARHNGTLPIGVVTDFWLPVSAIMALGGPPRALERRPAEAMFFVKARLRDGVTVPQARAAMDILGRRLAAEFPKEDPGKGITLIASSDVRVHPELDVVLVTFAGILLTVVGLVLAIACSNLATLLLVRGTARAKEVSIRLAVGAARGELVRHLLIESLLLSLAGGAAGCLVAWWALQSLGAVNLPIGLDVTLDMQVLAFTLVVSLVTGLLFGLAPALKATKVDLLSSLRDDGDTRSPEGRWLTLKNALVVSQVAVSALLLGVTSLSLQMMDAARAQSTGFAVSGVAMLQTDARYAGYATAAARAQADRLLQRVAAIPGVQAAALSAGAPMATIGAGIVIDGADATSQPAASVWAGPGFFETMQIPLLLGRVFDERDRLGAPRVALVNESMARRYFGTVNAVGRRFRFEPDPGFWLEVVGVVRDTRTADLGGDLVDPQPYLFFQPFTQSERLPAFVIARTSLDAAGLVGAMQRELRALDVTIPVVAAQTMAQSLENSLFVGQVATWFLGVLGSVGLGLAGIGLYAVVAFAVARRSREIGVRMALGARTAQVIWSVAREVATLVGAGTGIGLGLSLLAVLALRVVGSPAPGISLYRPHVDPVALMAIAAFMGMVGLAAALVPARRAARLDPLLALRRD